MVSPFLLSFCLLLFVLALLSSPFPQQYLYTNTQHYSEHWLLNNATHFSHVLLFRTCTLVQSFFFKAIWHHIFHLCIPWSQIGQTGHCVYLISWCISVCLFVVCCVQKHLPTMTGRHCSFRVISQNVRQTSNKSVCHSASLNLVAVISVPSTRNCDMCI